MNFFQKIVVLMFCSGLVLGVVEPLWAVGQDVVTDDEGIKNKLGKIPAEYGVYASSPGMLSLAKKQGRQVFADWGNNIYNSVSVETLKEMCSSVTLSPELSLQEIKVITEKTDVPCEILCHGYQTVMTSRACLIRGITGKCDCSKPISIKDKTGACFTILGVMSFKMFTLVCASSKRVWPGFLGRPEVMTTMLEPAASS